VIRAENLRGQGLAGGLPPHRRDRHHKKTARSDSG
jgi:hypothetical protein